MTYRVICTVQGVEQDSAEYLGDAWRVEYATEAEAERAAAELAETLGDYPELDQCAVYSVEATASPEGS